MQLIMMAKPQINRLTHHWLCAKRPEATRYCTANSSLEKPLINASASANPFVCLCV